MAQGAAILGMLCLHLFCRVDYLPYEPKIWIGGVPLIYYFGLFGDLCVPVFCFCSGYAQSVLITKDPARFLVNTFCRIGRFICHYWIIVCLFSSVGLLIGHDKIPGSWSDFAGNMFMYRMSYNGAWWFVVTYILLLPMTVIFARCIDRLNPFLILLASGACYFAAYVFRFVLILELPHPALQWMWKQIILLGTSQFSFVMGMLFHKHRIIDRLRMLKSICPRCFAAAIAVLPVGMFLLRCMEPSLVLAPLTGLTVIVCFHLWNKPAAIGKAFAFLGRHSTNLWLTHMFFYMTMFPELVFVAKSPVMSLIVLLTAGIASSYVIDGIELAGIKLVHIVAKGAAYRR